jgi:3-phenylpropionate/cinnamic acid dioxygenase small subunit
MPDPQAIQNLLYRYAELLDLGDFDGVAALFSQAEMIGPNGESQGFGSEQVKAIYQNFVRRYEDGTPKTHHVISNPIIEFSDDGVTATSRAYFTVFQATEKLALQAIIAGRYRDKFSYKNGQWVFTRRQFLPHLLGDMSQHSQQ